MFQIWLWINMSKSLSEGKTCNYKFFKISLVANMALQFRIILKPGWVKHHAIVLLNLNCASNLPWRGFRRARSEMRPWPEHYLKQFSYESRACSCGNRTHSYRRKSKIKNLLLLSTANAGFHHDPLCLTAILGWGKGRLAQINTCLKTGLVLALLCVPESKVLQLKSCC